MFKNSDYSAVQIGVSISVLSFIVIGILTVLFSFGKERYNMPIENKEKIEVLCVSDSLNTLDHNNIYRELSTVQKNHNEGTEIIIESLKEIKLELKKQNVKTDLMLKESKNIKEIKETMDILFGENL